MSKKRGSSGESLEHDAHPAVLTEGSIPGIACPPGEAQRLHTLSGVVLRGQDGFRFATGRQDGKAPAFPGLGNLPSMGIRK